MGLPVTLVCPTDFCGASYRYGSYCIKCQWLYDHAGTITSQMMRQTDKEIFNQEEEAEQCEVNHINN